MFDDLAGVVALAGVVVLEAGVAEEGSGEWVMVVVVVGSSEGMVLP